MLVLLGCSLGLPLSITLTWTELPLNGYHQVQGGTGVAPGSWGPEGLGQSFFFLWTMLPLPRDSVQLTAAWFLCAPPASGSSRSASSPGFPRIPGLLPQFASRCRLHGWACGPGLHPCLLHNAASDRLSDPSLGGASCPELAGRMLALALASMRDPPQEYPHSREGFVLFCFVLSWIPRKPFWGVSSFPTCSSAWEHHQDLVISFGIHHLDLSLFPPHTPSP